MAFYLTNCLRVASENTVNGLKVGVCAQEGGRERNLSSSLARTHS